MADAYKIVFKGGRGEIVEKKSRFIAQIEPIASEEEALTFIAQKKKEYWDARHNCYAYVLGGDQPLLRYSDDGEPAGTAGRPMLDVLTGQGIYNCVAVVTRYFGGTLLGTGGLVRAYQGAMREGLADAVIAMRETGRIYTVSVDYNSSGKLSHLLPEMQVPVLDTRYAENVTYDLLLTEEKEAAVLAAVTEQTAGKAVIEKGAVHAFVLADGEVILLDA